MNKNTLNNIIIPYLSDDEIDNEAVFIYKKLHKTRYMLKLILKYIIRFFIFITLLMLLFSFID